LFRHERHRTHLGFGWPRHRLDELGRWRPIWKHHDGEHNYGQSQRIRPGQHDDEQQRHQRELQRLGGRLEWNDERSGRQRGLVGLRRWGR
jgi:hypothetical protein